MSGLSIVPTVGSQKQIAWATDILQRPYQDLLHYAELAHQIPCTGTAYEAYLYEDASELYLMHLENVQDTLGTLKDSRWVIDHRDAFRKQARNILAEVKRSHGFMPSDGYTI